MRSKNPELMNDIKQFINDYYETNHRTPTVREIAAKMGVAPSCVQRYLVEMNERGMVSYVNGRLSTDRIDKLNTQTNSTPVVGTIPCGTPLLEEEYIEDYLPLPVSIFGSDDLYILRASGNSMIGVGIDDGDLVVIKKQNHAQPGDIVVALDEYNQNTLKTLSYDVCRHCYYLRPENSSYRSIYVKELVIQGVAQHVIKRL
ncbi:MAG: transcriptional repressor LexA [Clostridia bacterium]|nr:transcriptional repressor LexA [Clostridia bacterium]